MGNNFNEKSSEEGTLGLLLPKVAEGWMLPAEGWGAATGTHPIDIYGHSKTRVSLCRTATL